MEIVGGMKHVSDISEWLADISCFTDDLAPLILDQFVKDVLCEVPFFDGAARLLFYSVGPWHHVIIYHK